MKLIKNALLYTMDGAPIKNGCVLFDEKIIYAGEEKSFDNCEVIDAKGMVVMPGLIDAHCHVGMFEDSLGFEGDDGNEDTDPVTPHLRAIDGINPFDRGFEEARKAGVTTVVTGPGSANPMGGQFAAVKTYGICVDDMVVKAPAAMKAALGENPKCVYNEKDEAPVTRMGTMAMIREILIKAKNYLSQLEKHEADEDEEKPEYDMKLEALIPVLKRDIPMKIHAHRADDICSAIRLKKEFNIDVTIEHCTEGGLVAPVLKREKMDVMLGPTMTDRSKPELRNMSYATYKELSDMGLSVAIITDHPEISIENLPLCAAMALKHGMDKTKALEGITSAAAKNCRIDNICGTLTKGKDADICIMTALPTEFSAKNVMTVIRGEIVYKTEGYDV